MNVGNWKKSDQAATATQYAITSRLAFVHDVIVDFTLNIKYASERKANGSPGNMY